MYNLLYMKEFIFKLESDFLIYDKIQFEIFVNLNNYEPYYTFYLFD